MVGDEGVDLKRVTPARRSDADEPEGSRGDGGSGIWSEVARSSSGWSMTCWTYSRHRCPSGPKRVKGFLLPDHDGRLLVTAVNSSRASSKSERSSIEPPFAISESAESKALAFNAFRSGMVLSLIGELPDF